tara:strand:- start:437 stop:826 length:390 start_codon:yes stop_codon:yes gene_type:complete
MVEYYKQDEIKQYINDNINDYDLDEDLHHNLFNIDYYIVGYYQAEKWLGNNVYECIEVIKDYEMDNFGEVTTDFSNAENVVNMYAYIVGEHILQDCIKEFLRNKCTKLLLSDSENTEEIEDLFLQLIRI